MANKRIWYRIELIDGSVIEKTHKPQNGLDNMYFFKKYKGKKCIRVKKDDVKNISLAPANKCEIVKAFRDFKAMFQNISIEYKFQQRIKTYMNFLELTINEWNESEAF